MSVEMISAKKIVDWAPNGKHYEYEFCDVPGSPEESHLSVDRQTRNMSWKVRSCGGREEEIYVNKNRVVWTSNSEVSNSFPHFVLGTDSPVVDAFWASFFLPARYSSEGFVNHIAAENVGRLQHGLAVFEAERLTFLDNDGEQYTARLPCRLSSAWALETCILLERQPTLEELSQNKGNDNKRKLPPSSGNLFSLFSLTHPLDEAAPVLLKVTLPGGSSGVSFVNDINLNVVTIIASMGLVLTRHRFTGLHSLWQLEKAVPEDYVHLYEVGVDGRAYVAPNALNQFVCPVKPNFNRSSVDTSKVPATPGTGALQDAASLCSPGQNNVLQYSASGQACLSPFAASLSRFTGSRRLRGPLSRQGTINSVNSPVSPNSFSHTPVSLIAHISRMSNVPSARPNVASSIAGCSGNLRRSATGSQSGLISQSNSTIQYHSIPYSTTPIGRNSPNANALHTPGVSATPYNLNSMRSALPIEQAEDLLDEPLLPKVCLRLIWSESPPAEIHAKRVRWNSSIGRDTLTECGKFDLISGSTPTSALLQSPGGSHGTRFLVGSRRLVELGHTNIPTDPFPVSPLVTQEEFPRYVKAVESIPVVPNPVTAVVTGQPETADTSQSAVVRRKGFLALDFVSVPWICFLTGFGPLRPKRSSCLACLRVRSRPDVLNGVGTRMDEKQPVAPTERLTFLPAVDAVYVEGTRLIACLDPPTGIVLYSGIHRICLLGISPPPVLSAFSAIYGGGFPTPRMHKTLTRPLSVPFAIQPDAQEMARWRDNTIPALLNKVNSVVSGVLEQITPDGEFEISSTELYSPHGSACSVWPIELPVTDTINTLATVPLTETTMLCDPCGNAFTLNLKEHPFTGVANFEEQDRLFRVYLPEITENELVQRCLSSLHHCLPREVTLQLFSRWYIVCNSPGSQTSTNFSTEDTDESCDERVFFHGPPEWMRFALFILEACGLRIMQDERESSEQKAEEAVDQGFTHRTKRCRAADKVPCDADWEGLLHWQSMISADSAHQLPTIPNISTSPVSPKLLVRFCYFVRMDSASQLIMSHLPTILASFHLLYEELSLNCVLASSLQFFAELNLVLSRLLNLTSYETYYNLAWPNLTVDVSPLNTPIGCLIWPSYFPLTDPPCLLTWITQRLELPLKTDARPPSYVHLGGVNDLAVALAGMTLAAVYGDCRQSGSCGGAFEMVQHWLSVWQSHILSPNSCGLHDTAPNPESSTLVDGLIGEELHNYLDKRVPPLPKAFVQSMISLSEMRVREQTRTLENTRAVVKGQLRITQQIAESQHAALLYLSHLGETHLFGIHDSLTSHLRSLPRSLATVLRILLSRCQANPPPNCTPRMYNLMGRSDLARQAEMTITAQSSGRSTISTQSPRGPLLQRPLSPSDIAEKDKGLMESVVINRPGPQDYSSSWTLAERWANFVKPFRPTAANEKTKTAPNGRHGLLRCLECSPACQVAFKDDLRLREAYRLLQSTSHIRLPRLSADGIGSGSSPSGGGSSGAEGSRFTEPRLEMHLAAAGIRVWASAIGRGMLGLDSLSGFRIPTQLRVQPICLRGRAVSPSSGRRILVDLARESLTTLNTNNPAQSRNATGMPDAAMDLSDRRAGTGMPGLIPPGSEITGSSGSEESNDASNHPGNSMALAIASAVAASGAGAALRTASLNLPRMMPRSNLAMSYSSLHLSSLSANAAASTASLLATANLQQTPAVLAAKHWPDFHNGVAVGLSVSPHASIDATWIMYNCRLAGAISDARCGSHAQLNTSSTDLPTPEQAGLLFGLGLNGHLNKMTPYDIGEYLVRVHDLHNMAVLLGLCAGKRGTMDQSVLRLLAVHYRPLLPSDPLVHVQLSVPSLCQAAAVFGLGLLYQGSAHRHITNLLITELGRSLGGNSSSGPASANRKGGLFTPEVDAQQSVTNGPHTASTNPTTGWTGAAGTGGFAGDSCELIALSAGLALGLVLLQRGDTSCGLSDLAWAEKLHSYMLGGPREVDTPRPTQSRYSGVPHNFDEEYPHLATLRVQLLSRRGHMAQLRPGSISGPLSPSTEEPLLLDRYGRSDASFHMFDTVPGLPDLAVLMDDVFPGDFPLGLDDRPGTDQLHTTGLARGRSVSQPYTGGMRTGRVTVTGVNAMSPTGSGTVTGSTNSTGTGSERPAADANDFARRERRARSHWDVYQSSYKNSQIRELDCYNTDVSAPGAIMALGMAYLGTGNITVSQWLSPPTSLAQIELIRPDLFLFRALAHALVNWEAIDPSLPWIQSYCSLSLLERMRSLTQPVVDDFPEDLVLSPSMAELSSEDDVENRCPNPILAAAATVRQRIQRTTTAVGRDRTTTRQVAATNTSAPRRRRRRGNAMAPPITNDASRSKLVREFANWQSQFLPDSNSRVDEEAIGLAYLYMITGRAFALGLRYAGTCHAGAASVLFDLVQSILAENWWPPGVSNGETVSVSSTGIILPRPTIEFAIAHCLLALAMVLAGSGNLTVLRLVRKLRTIRLFRAKADQSQQPRSNPSNPSSRYNAVPSAAARAAGTHQAAAAAAAGSSSGTIAGGPVSVAAVFGAVLGPSFGIQMVYASIVGLLFLGGGRLTLSNTPEAAAILCISFFPILPDHSGDNWYHLQTLRHLYVLATRPRRLCAVDVDTGRVVLSDMRAKLQATKELITSQDTLIFPTNTLDELSWIELNPNSDKYWPTLFHKGTTNWKLLERAFEETGFLFVKRKDATEEIYFLKSWMSESRRHWSDPRFLNDLKLVASFLKRFPSHKNSEPDDGNIL
ncbi:ANAPC1 protein [Fasciola gigantica]|uniref:ANAPC1 protein n=1 Tax=Fasciola gigantica TaxID=46835 RepID=A0A504YET2_FASGI|nr:ANAPC1 protein [Fasciola gigantica]